MALSQTQTRRPFFRRRKTCPFSGSNAPKIDYKDVRLLQRYVSERGKIAKTEQWGVKSLAYRLRKNRKAHFTLLNIEAPPAALNEIERQQRLSEDVLRYLTVRVREHEEGPSAMMRKVDRDRERDDRGFGFRDRDRGGFRDRDRGEYRRDREGRPPREGHEDSAPGAGAATEE